MSDSNLWVYRESLARDSGTTQSPAGYEVVATDGSIGKVDEASEETSRHYLVVDTGFWIFGKKRLIPAGVITGVDHDTRQVYVAMTKAQIKRAPDFDEQSGRSDDAYYEKHTSYYDPYGW